MKIGNQICIAVIVLTALSAWSTKQTKDISKAEWLIGTWENRTPKGIIFETWSKETNVEFSGKSYIIQEKDTVVFENIRLIQGQDGLIYIPTVKNQNDDLPVHFASKVISETRLVFENPEHDFPQVISYTKINSDSLVAEISGTKDGRERRQVFAMKRTK